MDSFIIPNEQAQHDLVSVDRSIKVQTNQFTLWLIISLQSLMSNSPYLEQWNSYFEEDPSQTAQMRTLTLI